MAKRLYAASPKEMGHPYPLMLIIILLLVALAPSSSLPTPSLLPREAADVPGFRCEHDQVGTRNTKDILRSCLVTIFACAWVTVHPNIPGPKASEWLRFRRRCVTMIYAVIFPNMMVLWAMRQRYSAKKIIEEYNDKYHGNVGPLQGSARHELGKLIKTWFRGPEEKEKQLWTLNHGFFIQMGGFLFAENGKPSFVLTFKRLQELIDKGIIDPPPTTVRDILDKSKGNSLIKALVILQTTWFTVQCISRWASGLPVTGLEVVTLAFAALNIIAYSLWWHKPQHVQAAILITKRSNTPVLESNPLEVRRNWPERRHVGGGENTEGWFPWVVLIPLVLPTRLSPGYFVPLGKFSTESFVGENATQVPMFYAGHDITEEPKALLPLLGVSVIFGGMHLAVWFEEFPTGIEQFLWRTSAIVITLEPLLTTIAIGFSIFGPRHRTGTRFNMGMEVTILSLRYFAYCINPLYILARLALLILGFITLRRLDLFNPQALLDIRWTYFFPHI